MNRVNTQYDDGKCYCDDTVVLQMYVNWRLIKQMPMKMTVQITLWMDVRNYMCTCLCYSTQCYHQSVVSQRNLHYIKIPETLSTTQCSEGCPSKSSFFDSKHEIIQHLCFKGNVGRLNTRYASTAHKETGESRWQKVSFCLLYVLKWYSYWRKPNYEQGENLFVVS